MPRVVHFEINADDPKRAIEFYRNVFGWKISKWDGPSDYWLLTTGDKGQPGIDGGLMKRAEPGSSTCNTIDVPSVDACSELIESTGGEVVVPKMAIPGVGQIAYCKDTEGNMFGIIEFEESAK